jgi:hypothetical protein
MNTTSLFSDNKTRIAAVLGVGFAVSKVLESFNLPHLTPNQMEAIAALGLSLGFLGLRHGIEKNTEAVVVAGETAATQAANAAQAVAEAAVIAQPAMTEAPLTPAAEARAASRRERTGEQEPEA